MSVYFHPNAINGDYNSLPDTNTSNANAVGVLVALGLATFESDFADICCGSCPTADFMGRVLLALALSPTDEGTTTVAYRQGDSVMGAGATVYDLGRSAGYLQVKLQALRKIAQWALDNDRAEIVWG